MIAKKPKLQKTAQTNKQGLLNAISSHLDDKSIKHDSFELNKYADNFIAFFTLLHETSVKLED